MKASGLLLALLLPLALSWTAAGHDLGAQDAHSPVLPPGASYAETAHAQGVVSYHCHLHPGMGGTLEVLPPSSPGASAVVRIAIRDDGNATHLSAMRFSDAAGGNRTTVHAGDTLLWENEGQSPHDVHIGWSSLAGRDSGAFELWIAAGLVVVLTGIAVAARRV
ncbi:MAG TPA: hypothetical protein VM286_03660 [Candidatus Thermoplasmatota archaeon]|nr:hypothetical protein [Candidatus Thermoplasmatota archaeon]